MSSAPGLSSLGSRALAPANAAWHEALSMSARGSSVWRARKAAEMHDLIALTELAPPGRLRIEELDPTQALRAMLLLRVPVPVRAGTEDTLGGIARYALLGLVYPQEALRRALPGFAFVQILSPAGVFHANVAPDPVQPLCLGATLPPGVRLIELVLMSYGALAMQSVMLDASDAAGVMNPAAARWWLANRERLPLSTAPFLAGDDLPASPGAAAERAS